MSYQTFKIGPPFFVEAVNSRVSLVLSDAQKIRVDTLWESAQKKRGGPLFNGKFLNFIGYNPQQNRLTGEFIEYKYYVAQLLDHELKSVLDIRPISVSCICMENDWVLIGKRSAAVTDYPNRYELVPSGGVDPDSLDGNRVDVGKQAVRELREEAGISTDHVKICQPRELIFDRQSGLWEVIVHLQVEGATAVDLQPSAEYSELQWISRKAVATLVAEIGENAFVPLSLFLLNI